MKDPGSMFRYYQASNSLSVYLGQRVPKEANQATHFWLFGLLKISI